MANRLALLEIAVIWIRLPTERAREQFLELLRLLAELRDAHIQQTRRPASRQRSPEAPQKSPGPPRTMWPYQ